MNKKYRFYYFSQGKKYYYTSPASTTLNRRKASLFTAEDYEQWNAAQRGIEREEVGEDVLMRASGAPMLPGFGD